MPHGEPIDAVLAHLDAPLDGLMAAEVAACLARHGPNRPPRQPRTSLLAIVAAQFRSVVVVLLASAAVTSLLSGERLDAAAIVIVSRVRRRGSSIAAETHRMAPGSPRVRHVRITA